MKFLKFEQNFSILFIHLNLNRYVSGKIHFQQKSLILHFNVPSILQTPDTLLEQKIKIKNKRNVDVINTDLSFYLLKPLKFILTTTQSFPRWSWFGLWMSIEEKVLHIVSALSLVILIHDGIDNRDENFNIT